MPRGPKPAKSKEAKPPTTRKSPKDGSINRDFEARLAEALRDKAEALKLQAEAQDQQAATAEILGVIGASPTDVQPVFDAIASSAAHLCESYDVAIRRLEGDGLRLVAHHGPIPASALIPVMRGSVSGRAVLERRTVHVDDIQGAADEFPEGAKLGREAGVRTNLGVPLLRKGLPLGAIVMRRAETKPFTDKEIRLLQTFADQAVIAIENVRLFTETKEALEQQTATSEILRVISQSHTDVQPVFDTIADSAIRLFRAWSVAVHRYDGELMQIGARRGGLPDSEDLRNYRSPRRPSAKSPLGRAILERAVHHEADAQSIPDREAREVARVRGFRTIMAAPMLRDGEPVGVIGVTRREVRPFTDAEIELLKTFADQAVIAIENVRLFKELEARNRDLTGALDRETATSEVLRVISSSPTDVQPVFDAIVQSAVTLCGAILGAIYRRDGSLVRLVGLDPRYPHAEEVRATYPAPVTSRLMSCRAIHENAIIQLPDTETPGVLPPEGLRLARLSGFQSVVAVPMRREGEPIGAILVGRPAVGAFPDEQIGLLQAFADQAVIAIENVRLFNETKEALERQTATSEILRVIAASPTDVQPVFDTIVESAARLCNAQFCHVLRFDGALLHLAAHHGMSPEGIAALQSVYPLAPGRGSAAGRSILSGRIEQIRDTNADADFRHSRTAVIIGAQSVVAVPMLRDGMPIGSIVAGHSNIGVLPERLITLLQTFADQAVIAIENVRLFKELEARNKDLRASLDQQTATAEVLKVISRSAFDLQAVLTTLLENATRLCGAEWGVIFRPDGEVHRMAVVYGAPPEFSEFLTRTAIPPGRGSGVGRAALERRTVQVVDVAADPEYELTEFYQIGGFRTVLAVPMLRDGVLLGVFGLHRDKVQPFTEQQIELVTTFADQGVIAIENVRLFNETKEALERQTATAEILRVISSSPTDIQPVLDTVAESAARLCEADDTSVFRLEGDRLRRVAHHGPIPAGVIGEFTVPLVRGSFAGRSVLDGRIVHLADGQTEAKEFPEGSQFARRLGFRAILLVPLLREGVAIGSISLRRTEARLFTERQVALLQTFADQAVIAIENVRLFKELETRNKQLTEALEQQTATSDVLRVISSSPTDLVPVFREILVSAARLCDAQLAFLFRYDDGLFELISHWGDERSADFAAVAFPRARFEASPNIGLGRIAAELRPVQIADLTQDSAYAEREPLRVMTVEIGGCRTWLGVPLLKEGHLVGAFVIWRREVNPFTDRQIALVSTFADQAVIAIENVRLFKELEARTQDLSRSVDELRALGEVGQAISSTLDLRTVLSTIVARATQLSRTDAGVIYEYDERRELFEPRATEHLEEDIVRALVATPIRKGEGATGKLADVREPLQVSDVRDIAQAFQAREVLVRAGYRAALAVPLVREDHLLGGLTVFRKTPGDFAPEVIDLLRTFATQSALAIQNARLFREIEIKSRELAAASQHKSEFLANMSHELRTPLNAIIGFSEVLSEKMFGELNEKQEEYSKDIHASGQHLLSLINDILDLSKIEAGRMELELTDFDLPTAIENALMLVRERAGRRSIALHTNVDRRLGQIQADERKVRQVVLNLLSNAIKFTPEGGRIEVAAVPKDGLVEISVSDTGVGIAPEDQEAVFEEFRQVGTADKKVEGTGLGLTLCRKFVELHGGRIWVKSEVGVGSTFTFSLPLQAVANDEGQERAR